MSLKSNLTFGRGLKDGVPIALGYLSVSFAFGMSAASKGFPFWSPCLISLTNFTGTGQFVGVDLIAAKAGLFELAFTLLIINLRYLLMSLSLSQRLAPNVGLGKRLLIAFGNTDEIFAVAMQQEGLLPFRYMGGLIISSFSGWVFGTAIGAGASNLMPAAICSALGIAVYAMFIAIIVPPARKHQPVLRIVLIAITLSSVFFFVPPFHSLSSGWSIIICGAIASAYGAYFYPLRDDDNLSGESEEGGEQNDN
ncbi:MAG: AzlC family ABC transporter permease [Clostridia bacterium]|nr:AzlC family ABC transporter permease [Clostridia bacterium]